MRMVRWLGCIVLLICNCFAANASHIVGGELTYVCLGPAPGAPGYMQYRVKLDIYQDCYSGNAVAITEDNPAILGIFKANGTPYLIDSFLFLPQFDPNNPITVPPNFSNDCVNNPPVTCLRKATFSQVYTLPANESFLVAYQRCCRNATILNIFKPGEMGATYYCTIPPAVGNACNNSAVYKEYPPQIICANIPFIYNHSASDPDGDSLSYEFCEAYIGGEISDAKPIPKPPPYTPVTYIGGFSAVKPMAGNPVIRIDPVTGIITGTPNISGRFVVTVCCHEWRNGQIINTVKREFQFVVTECSKAVVANIPQYSNEFNTYIVECKSNTVDFDNLSTGGETYYWDFGVPDSETDTSTQFEPTFTYPDTGTYVVKLVVNRGRKCSDSIARYVKVYPSFFGFYTFDGFFCPGSPITFSDSSVSTTHYVTNSWIWNFGDGTSAFEENPMHTFATGGTYPVVLISGNTRGCTDTVKENVTIDQFRPFAGGDTIIVKGESINFNARGGGTYTWIPATNLSDPNIVNPVGFYPDTGTFSYIVHITSPSQCVGSDSITVKVVAQGALFVPTGFTPNGDGRNDILRPIGIGYRDIKYFRVFNRWGEQVFYTTQFGQGWDGFWKGRPADIGTYFWVLGITNRFGEEELVKGDSELIR